MLNQMRALSQHLVGRAIMAVVLGLIILSFAIWGIGDRFTNFNADQLASVGSTKITVDQYRTAYQNELQRLQEKAKRGITTARSSRGSSATRSLTRKRKSLVLPSATKRSPARSARTRCFAARTAGSTVTASTCCSPTTT